MSGAFADTIAKLSCLPCDGGAEPMPRSEEIVYKRNYAGDNGPGDVEPDTIKYNEVKKKRCKKRDREQACWLCARTTGKRAPGSALGRFYRLFSDQYRYLEDDVLYPQLKEFFDSQVRAPLLLQSVECPDLTPEEIKQHLLEHNLDPGVWVSEEIRTLKNVCGVMRDQMFTDKEGAVDLNDKRVLNYLKVQKQITDLYNARLPNMNYFDAHNNVAR